MFALIDIRDTPAMVRDLWPAAAPCTADFVLVDVSNVTPQPQPGWTTPDGGKTFVAPPAPAVDPKTAARAKLAALDQKIPRGLEDMWAATSFDTTKLPQVQQQNLAAKVAARAVLAGT